ncbi:hypothetical protein F4555_000651 [Mobiluncus mulieris]|nr:hypothetical protein [Mobiluncus mulieris]
MFPPWGQPGLRLVVALRVHEVQGVIGYIMNGTS